MTGKETKGIKKLYLNNYAQVLTFLVLSFVGFLGSIIGVIVYSRTEDKILFGFLLLLSIFFILISFWYITQKREDNEN